MSWIFSPSVFFSTTTFVCEDPLLRVDGSFCSLEELSLITARVVVVVVVQFLRLFVFWAREGRRRVSIPFEEFSTFEENTFLPVANDDDIVERDATLIVCARVLNSEREIKREENTNRKTRAHFL